MSFCRRTVEDRLPLERVPLACTFGSPLDLHVRQSLGLQGPVDLDHHLISLYKGHEATETGLAYAPASQAHGHNHIVQCFACCTAA